MKDLIKVEINENLEPIVNGRELYEVLGIKTPYTQWFDRMKEYGFIENIDFATVSQKCEIANGGYQEKINHAIKLDMAKEIAMIQRNEKGKKVRQYFIQVEKDFNSPDKIMAKALMLADKQIKTLQLENTQQKQIIGELKPKADYLDTILKNKSIMTVTPIAKDYGMSATQFNKKLHQLGVQFKQSGQWFLYRQYQNCGYTHSKTTEITHKDGTKELKLNTEWTQKGRLFLYELLKKNGLVPVIER
ncbi:MAG: phage antirepressor Ant [Clostridia bacterium]|nr:phage antirepressor Ant [Clostridia bacterium]